MRVESGAPSTRLSAGKFSPKVEVPRMRQAPTRPRQSSSARQCVEVFLAGTFMMVMI